MNINRDELRQITLFKDSVLSAADTRRMEIISQAQKEGDEAIAGARAMCRLSDHATVEQRLALDTERQTSAATQAARQQLLAARQKLVDDMFSQVEEQLLAFTKEESYGDWLVKKLAAHTFAGGGGSRSACAKGTWPGPTR